MKTTINLLIALFAITTLFAQETETNNSIDNQFRTLYKNSNNYQEYKVVRKNSYGTLHNNVLDTLKQFKTLLTRKNTLINSQKEIITTLEKEKTATNVKLTAALEKENTISLLGIQLSKSNYSIILFSCIALLIIALTTFVYKFNNSNVVTKEAKNNLEDVENEFNLFRKKTLEREQKLRRELQDEIIKNRNN